MKDGTPLPTSLSGNVVQRLIEIDEALLYLVNGALVYLVDKEPLEQTGTLTVEVARAALDVMLETYFNGVVSMTPVGATMIWHMDTPPDRWLICDGTGHLKSEYPELYALFGGKYGESIDFFGVPDLRSRSPYGADFDIELDEAAGEMTHTLTVNEIPAHGHNIKIGTAAGTGAHPHANTNQANQVTSYAAIAETGGGMSHNNLHPVRGVNFIVYAGR